MTSDDELRTRVGWALPRLAHLVVPGLVALAVGCNSLNFFRSRDKVEERVEQRSTPRTERNGLPGKYDFRIAPYVFLSDFPIKHDQPLFKELAQLRDQVQKELLLPPSDAVVQVYLFETKERYEAFMQEKYPELPRRRAFFVAQPRTIGGAEDLLVYTYWGDRIRQDLRHELTHGLLHSVIKDVPLWLDEGLAEFFELPPEQQGINPVHVRMLRRDLDSGAYKLGLGRLEGLDKVAQMNPREYREAWAWVHLMLRTRPEVRTVLLSYLQQLRLNRHPGTLEPKLALVCPNPDEGLLAHVAGLDRVLERFRVAAPPR